MDKVKSYLKETIEELRYKVTWPPFTDLQKNSGMVLAGSLIFALLVGLMDYIYDNSLSFFYNSF